MKVMLTNLALQSDDDDDNVHPSDVTVTTTPGVASLAK